MPVSPMSSAVRRARGADLERSGEPVPPAVLEVLPRRRSVSVRQARYWIGTIPRAEWEPCLPEGACWIKGQPEKGEETGYLHWQILVGFPSKKSLRQVRELFSVGHFEPTRSDAADAYVHKERTRDGEPFEFGKKSVRRNNENDWEGIKEMAKKGELDSVPADVYIRYYRTLVCIAADNAVPEGIVKTVYVFYGKTGTGKSRRAWEEAGPAAYGKDPRTKFWCGYRGNVNVVIDEFRGGIDIGHMLRWLDRYPVNIEVKGASRPLMAQKIWITSNLHPMNWYVDLDFETKDALMRRLQITEFQ